MTNTIQELVVNEVWRDEQDAWNNRSNYFVEMHNRDDRKAQVTEFLSFLKDENLLPQNGGRTLDVGCGVCDYALGLAREGYKATGIDLSDGMIRGAKQLAETEGFRFHMRACINAMFGIFPNLFTLFAKLPLRRMVLIMTIDANNLVHSF